MSVPRLLTSAATVSVSVVKGVTVNAFAEYTTSAVWPLARRSSMSRILSRARSKRLGEISCASIERDRSRATTSACSERNTGCSMRCQAGPASARTPSTPAMASSSQRESAPVSCEPDKTCGASCGSTTYSQLPGPRRRRANKTAVTNTSGNANSHSGRMKCRSASTGLNPRGSSHNDVL